MGIRLRYLAHDLEVPLGEFCIGRSTDCQLSLDDPLVSRRHALLTVDANGGIIEDLGSRNGVLVNGVRITSRHRLADGDRITLGNQELVLLGVAGSGPPPAELDRKSRQTQSSPSMHFAELCGDDDGRTAIGSTATGAVASHPDKRVHALSLIGSVADKALALGRQDEAERILQHSLGDIMAKVRTGAEVQPELIEKASAYAVRLAGATGRGAWITYAFELNARLGTLLPATTVDELYSVLRKVKAVDMTMLRLYAARLRERLPEFSPAERFVLQRIEGLQRLGTFK